MIFETFSGWKYLFITSFRLSDCSLQWVVIKYNDYRRVRFTITEHMPTPTVNNYSDKQITGSDSSAYILLYEL
jgi:hypothetical protein